MKFLLMTLVILLFVPGLIFAAMFILMINGINVNVNGFMTLAVASTIGAELYGIIKIM